MKKLDKLIISSFLGPFFLTFFVVIFLLLTQFMLKYFDDLVGKDLGFWIIAKLVFYFSINMTTNAFPLAVLLSSLMTFGNLGEHSELTAVKASGISLIRAMRSLFVFTLLLMMVAYYFNNFFVPNANLEAYSLLYDIKHKKPALDIKEGVFYNRIDGKSIKINKKFPDGETLKGIMIYDHTERGNQLVILADSGRMYNLMGERYLVFELFNGKRIIEQMDNSRRRNMAAPSRFVRTEFERSKMIFDMESFALQQTKKTLFAGNRLMKTAAQLKIDIDSLDQKCEYLNDETRSRTLSFLRFHMNVIKDKYDSIYNYKAEQLVKREEENLFVEQENTDEGDNKKEEAEQENSLSQVEDTKVETEGAVLNVNEQKQVIRPDSTLQQNIKARQIVSREKMLSMDRRKILARADSSSTLRAKVLKHKIDSAKSKTQTINDKQEAILEDSLLAQKEPISYDSLLSRIDSILLTYHSRNEAYKVVMGNVRYTLNHLKQQAPSLENMMVEKNKFAIEYYKRFAMAFMVVVMFLIGAPLGAIIKKGGLGMPVLVSILFLVAFYVISMNCEKWARQGLISPFVAAWAANVILLPFGLFFMKQARKDARLFEADFYQLLIKKVKTVFAKNKKEDN